MSCIDTNVDPINNIKLTCILQWNVYEESPGESNENSHSPWYSGDGADPDGVPKYEKSVFNIVNMKQ